MGRVGSTTVPIWSGTKTGRSLLASTTNSWCMALKFDNMGSVSCRRLNAPIHAIHLTPVQTCPKCSMQHSPHARAPSSTLSQRNCTSQLYVDSNVFRRVRNLRELRLDGNQLSRLPDSVPELRGLEVLDLRGNSIETLPPELKFLRCLLDLDLEGNPIGPQVMLRKQIFLARSVVVFHGLC